MTLIGIAGAITIFLLLKKMSLVSPGTARERLAKGALVIDVRSPQEFEGRHLPGAVNIPLDRLSAEIERRAPDREQGILLHCLSGGRSTVGKGLLRRMGYRAVFNLGSYRRAAKILDTGGRSQN